MAAVGQRVTVTTTAIALNATAEPKNQSITIRNTDSANSVFLGGAGVTAATGYELKFGVTLQLTLLEGESLWAISAGSVRVDVLQLDA